MPQDERGPHANASWVSRSNVDTPMKPTQIRSGLPPVSYGVDFAAAPTIGIAKNATKYTPMAAVYTLWVPKRSSRTGYKKNNTKILNTPVNPRAIPISLG